MNAAHFHLLVNHLPVIFPVAGLIAMIAGLTLFKSDAVIRTAYLLFVIGSLSSVAAMTSGENAEEVLENLGGVDETYIESHEESAEVYSILTYIMAGLSLLGLWATYRKRTISATVIAATMIFTAVSLYFGIQTGASGGEIRHPEIRSAGAQPAMIRMNEEEEHED